MLPMVSSPLAEMVPTWAISFLSLVGLDSFFSSADHGLHRLVDAALELHRAVAGGDQLQALLVDGPREHGGGGGAVAGLVGGLAGDLLHHLRAHVLEPVLEVDLLGDGDAVLGDRGRAERLLDDHVAALGAEGHRDRVGQDANAAQDGVARALVEVDFLGCHLQTSGKPGFFEIRRDWHSPAASANLKVCRTLSTASSAPAENGTLGGRAHPLRRRRRGHGARHPLAGRARGAGQDARGPGGRLGARARLPRRALPGRAPHLGPHHPLRGQRHPAHPHRAPEPARRRQRLADERAARTSSSSPRSARTW